MLVFSALRRAHWAIAAGVAALLAPPATAATILVENHDAPGVGFNDATAAAPIGGNDATTRGAQALRAFEHAADLWAAVLDSPVPIRVEAEFAPLACTATSGVLGSAAPRTFAINAPGLAPSTWYPIALANALGGADLVPAEPDIDAHFNGAAGTTGCLEGAGWYFGFDANPGLGTDLVSVVLHELAHGLGMTTPVDLATGALFNGSPDVFASLLFDERSGLSWPEMSDAERADSARSFQELVWGGPEVTAEARDALGSGVATVALGPPLDLWPVIALATFGPRLTATAIEGVASAVNDGVGSPGDACETAASLAGNVAFVEAGGCADVDKVLSVQAAGAVAAIVVDDRTTPPPLPLTGVGAVTIPAVRVTQEDGALLRASLGSNVTATFRFDPDRRIGTSPSGRVYLNATNPVQTGRSVTHWDPIASPDLLMEPAPRVGHGLDLTLPLLRDLGWRPAGSSADAGADADATPDGGPGADASSPDADGGSTATGGAAGNTGGAAGRTGGAPGAGGGSSRGGRAGGPEGGVAGSSSEDGGTGRARDDSGCGCRAAGGRDGRSGAWVLPLVLWAARRRRARAQR